MGPSWLSLCRHGGAFRSICWVRTTECKALVSPESWASAAPHFHGPRLPAATSGAPWPLRPLGHLGSGEPDSEPVRGPLSAHAPREGAVGKKPLGAMYREQWKCLPRGVRAPSLGGSKLNPGTLQ